MKKMTIFTLAAALLLQNLPPLSAAQTATVSSVEVADGSVLITADRPVEYKAFTMESPFRLVLDLQDAKMRTLQEIPVSGSNLRKVRTSQFKSAPGGVSRVVMELAQRSAHEITRRGPELVISFGAHSSGAQVKDAPAAPAAAPVVKIIPPAAKAPAAAKPAEMTIEPADQARERAQVIAPKKRSSSSGGRNIMDTLSAEPISFEYNEADIREVLDMMAAKAGINIIYSDDVSGTVTLSLAKVPFDEAFKTLLNAKSLAAQQIGDNILRIASPKTFLSEQKSAMLQTRVIFLNYTKASEMKTQLDAVAANEGRTTGKCAADDVNNALVITDTSFGLDATVRLIRSLDRMPKQVMIEVKLVEVKLDDSFELGVNWNFSNVDNAGNGTSGRVFLPGPTPGLFNAGSLTIGKISGNNSFNAVIAAAAKKGKAKVLSDPKVATLNNKEANINITDQTPFDQQTISLVNGVQTITHAYSNVTTGITLKVTPTINSDGRITMHIVPAVIQLSGVPNGIAPPPTATRGTDTNVIVRNDETIVIGGLIQDTQSEEVYKIPLLGDIPLLGAAFRKKTVVRSRKELLIFVTPKIIED
ncbi:MAG TPA: AMIN domain-containing protein [Elusimicrobiales bacterium]|nr:AMIN domain-containing protein [Elusimicrobiales bacterium]